MRWGNPQEIETRRRIMLSVWAYAYEIQNVSLVPDHVFDAESLKINLAIATTRPDLDDWFRQYFNPHTGMWVRHHPELSKVKELYKRFYMGENKCY